MTDPLLGAVAGGYRVVSLLSVGGMGSVYRAEHALIGRPAAIKVLLPEMSTNRDMVQRFFNEAKATTAIKHPGIVEVFDFGYLPSGQAYIVMELLDGMTLAQRARAQGRMHEGEAAMILRSVCGALAAAHATGVVHRDLKPDNIFLVADSDAPLGVRCKLLDFGIAKLTSLGAASSATKTGAVMGTPTYMSPEQCKGSGDVDARADLYSLGCIFYELVTGRPPFVCEGAGELLGSHLFVEPDPPSRLVPGITPDAETLILQLLAKQPARRVQSARELAARVSALASAHGWAVSSTDLDARLAMASIQLGAPDESTQLAPLPTPVPHDATSPAAVAYAPPNEDTQPIAMPLPPSAYETAASAAMQSGRATAPMPLPTPPIVSRVPTPMPMRMPMGAPLAIHTPMPPIAAAMPTPMPPIVAYVPTPRPMPAYVPTPLPMAAYVPTPTTLSGAAREAQAMGPGSGKLRAGRLAAVLVLAGVAVGAIVFFAVGGGGSGGAPTRPAAAPIDAAAFVVVPTPTPTPTPPPPPAPVVPAATIDAAVAPPIDASAIELPAPDAAAATVPVDAPAAPAASVDAAAKPAATPPHTPGKPKPRPRPTDTDPLLEPKL